MSDISGFISGSLLIFSLVYLIILRPIFEKKRDETIFDNRVIAFVDGLYLGSIAWNYKCANSDIKRYVIDQLKKAHKLPSNQFLIEYTTQKGWHYSSHTGPNDYQLFALLCIAEYAKDFGNDELVAFCEERMRDASRMSFSTI